MDPIRETPAAKQIDRIVGKSLRLRDWPQDFRERYLEHSSARLLHEGKFLLRMGLLACVMSMAIDFMILPKMVVEGALLRLLIVAPLVFGGLYSATQKYVRATQVFLATSLTAFACIAVHLATHMPVEYAPRYIMAIALLPTIANVIMPVPPRNLVHFNIFYLIATFATLAISAPHSIIGHLDYFIIMVISSIITIPIVQRLEKFNRQNFLFTLQHRLDAEELIEANRILRELSERDPLTGMPNRRCFERVFHEGCDKVAAGDVGRMALMMIDLDHFKAFNDRHGHQAGDQCLRSVGITLTRVFSNYEGLVARFGGEEFIGIVKEETPGAAIKLAEDVRRAIEALPGRSDGQPLITASIGLAVTPGKMKFACEDLIEMADAALYSAKRAGRNRVEIVEAGGLEELSA